MSKTVSGRIHDKKLADFLDAGRRLKLNGDLGFFGFKHKKISVKKHTKGLKLRN